MTRRVLVTCGGKWVGMVLALRQALSELGGGEVIVADRDPLTPAGCFADDRVHVPAIADSNYVTALANYARERGISAIVPLIDIDIDRLDRERSVLAEAGVHLVAPPREVIDLCLDKALFQTVCDEEDLATPRSFISLEAATYPLFYKPRRGFGSIGTGRADTPAEVPAAAERYELVHQELVEAPEVSVDGYVNREGRCTVLVPRMRDKVIGGEAQRSHTIEDPETWELAMRTVRALASRGLRGPVNVQLFLSEPRKLIEVNTRLGSCSVLSNAATGGRLLRSVLEEAFGGTATGDPSDYERGLWIYRYTGDVFHRGDQPTRFAPARSPEPVEILS